MTPHQSNNPTILFLAADCPGFYVDTIHAMAGQLVERGYVTLFAATTPFYEQFRGLKFEQHGSVNYLSDFLSAFPVNRDLEKIPLDYWKIYPTFIRYSYYYGSHDNDWDTYKKIVVFYRELFSEYAIDLVVSEPPSNAFLYLGYEAAESRGIPYFGFMPARVKGYFNVYLNPYGETLLENPAPPIQWENDFSTPDYMSNPTNDLSSISTIRFLRTKAKRFLKSMQINAEPSVETGNTFRLQLEAYRILIFRKWRHWRAEKIDKVFEDSFEFMQDEVKILFPLQSRPEASTAVLARYYGDDKEIIKNIAFSKSSDAVLYVKEHPAAIGIRDKSFYKEICSYPGVHLLHPKVSLHEILRHFDAVVTLTSTVGFEALQIGLPVLLLGRTFYSSYPGVTTIESYADLHDHLKSICISRNRSPDPGIKLRYLQYCFPGSFNYMDANVTSPQNISNLIEPVINNLPRQVDVDESGSLPGGKTLSSSAG